MKNLTLLPSNNLISGLDSNNNSPLETAGLATLTNNLKFAQQINSPGPGPLPTFTGRIQGTKFTNDLNRNGIFEPGEDQPQPGVTIFLDLNNNGQLDGGDLQTQTDSLGGYSFSNLPPATYTVQEIVPPGFERVTPVQAVTVANGTANFDIVNRQNFVQPPPIFTGRISGRKFNDLNRNGRLEAGSDQPQSGVTLFLDQNSNGQLDSGELQTQTDSLGGYSFSNLPPATYTVQEIVPAGFTRVTPVQAVTVANETTNFDILNIAQTPPTVTGSISGRKFNDINANGIIDVGEPGIPGFTIYIDLNRNNIFDSSEPSRLTDATGSYQFNDLQPDTYTLREVQQPGFVATQVPDPVTIPLSTSATVANFTNINFGNRRDTGSISGRKFIDVNNDRTFTAGSDQPQSGVTLFLDINNNAQPDSGELQTQTDSLGGYSFSNLPPASYTVQEIVPAGFTRITPVQAVAVVANQTTNFDILNGFSFVPPPTVTGSISGRKFNDINANGILDVGEPGIPGFTIYIDLNRNNLLDSSEPSRLTDATGSYLFNDLQPGTYTLREVQQPGFVATQVPNPVTIPLSTSATVANFININFGNRRDTGSISGRKFIDVNANRTFEPGTDQPQSGVTLFLDINNNAQPDSGELQTQTDSLGGYSFSNLPPASYTVQEIVPAGFTRVTPVQPVTVVPNETTNFDILNIAQTPPPVTGSISGRKFIDVNNDRTFTPGSDRPQSGVTLFLDINNNAQLDSGELQSQTDSLGDYFFSQLPPASYTVQEIVPAGFTRVTPVQPVT
ncbi:SdrD B-like domain-containing protein, partial [Microcoleus sp. AT9_A5]